MESQGYDMEVITKAHPDMYCVVCVKLMREPVQFKCTHGICKPCYQRIFVAACKKYDHFLFRNFIDVSGFVVCMCVCLWVCTFVRVCGGRGEWHCAGV